MPDEVTLPATPLHALCVYAEPLVVGRRVVVLGDTRRRLGERLLELGARVVHVYDPEPARAASAAARAPRGLTVHALPSGEFDVRDGAFDVAIVADVADLPSPAAVLGRVRRLLASGGAVLVRSSAAAAGGQKPPPGSLDYYELYDLVAMQFAHVRMVGQVAWSGVALAELGREGDEPELTVDTQLVTEADPPEAFIAVGSQDGVALAEYALVQLPRAPQVDVAATIAAGSGRADLAAAQLRASLLEAQVEELRALRNSEGVGHADAVGALEAELANRITELQLVEGRTAHATNRAERAQAELRAREEDLARLRDRAALAQKELEDERRLRSRAEVALASSLERRGSDDDRAALVAGAALALEGQVVTLSRALSDAEGARVRVEVALAAALLEVEALRSRSVVVDDGAARAAWARVAELEAALSALEGELRQGDGHGHGAELAVLEESLRERGRVTHALERELERRERIILDLVHALEEARDAVGAPAPEARRDVDGELALADATRRASRVQAENEELGRKLDLAAGEVARREAEIATSAWRIQELEQAIVRLEDETSETTMTIPPPAFVQLEREVNDVTKLSERLGAAQDELDVLRQALAQEHEARVRAESGDALAQARGELARQAVLLEKLSKELEAHDGVRRVSAEGAPG